MIRCIQCEMGPDADGLFYIDHGTYTEGPFCKKCLYCARGVQKKETDMKETEFQKFHRWYDNYSKVWPIPSRDEEKMFLAWDACSKSKRGLDDNGEFVEANSENRFTFNMTNEELHRAVARTVEEIKISGDECLYDTIKLLREHLEALLKTERVRADMMQIKESKP